MPPQDTLAQEVGGLKAEQFIPELSWQSLKVVLLMDESHDLEIKQRDGESSFLVIHARLRAGEVTVADENILSSCLTWSLV